MAAASDRPVVAHRAVAVLNDIGRARVRTLVVTFAVAVLVGVVAGVWTS